MNILFLTFDLAPGARWGMGHQVGHLLDGIQASHPEVSARVCHPYHSPASSRSHEITASAEANRLLLRVDPAGADSYGCFRLLQAWNVSLLGRAIAAMSAEQWKPDALHCSGWMPWTLAHSLSIRYDVPITLSLHIIEGQYQLVGSHPSGIDEALIRTLEREAVDEATQVIVPSDQARELASEMIAGVRPEKLNVVPHGLCVASANATRIGGRPHLLFVGRLSPEKGIQEFIDALHSVRAAHPDIIVTVVGDGPAAANMRLPAEAEDWVRFTGQLDHASVIEIMANADIVCCPSLVETFGLVSIEAMSLGRAVVCTSGRGICCNVEHMKTGLVVPVISSSGHNKVDVGLLSTSISTLLTDAVLRRKLGVAARRVAQEKYSVYTMVDRTLDVISRSVAQWNPRRRPLM